MFVGQERPSRKRRVCVVRFTRGPPVSCLYYALDMTEANIQRTSELVWIGVCVFKRVCLCVRAFLRVRGRVVYVWVVIVSVHLQERLQVVRNLRSYLRDDFVTMKHINSQPSLSSHPILAEDPSIYRWGRHSDDVIIEVGILCKFIGSIHRSSSHTSNVTTVVSHLSITRSSTLWASFNMGRPFYSMDRGVALWTVAQLANKAS